MKTDNKVFINTLLSVLPNEIKNDLILALQELKLDKTKEYKSFTDIKTFDDACRVLGSSEAEFNTAFEGLNLDLDTINYERLKILVKAINMGWTPDWSNTNQAKWFPWFDVRPSGSGFSYSYSHYLYDITHVGSRLCFESEEKCKYAVSQFGDIYNAYLL